MKHVIRKCECGIVITQCRCIAPDKTIEIVSPCAHGKDQMITTGEFPKCHRCGKTYIAVLSREQCNICFTLYEEMRQKLYDIFLDCDYYDQHRNKGCGYEGYYCQMHKNMLNEAIVFMESRLGSGKK